VFFSVGCNGFFVWGFAAGETAYVDGCETKYPSINAPKLIITTSFNKPGNCNFIQFSPSV
jgi:hypothetical protein